MIFLQQRKQLQIIIRITVIKGQQHRFFNLINARQVFKPDRLIPVVHQVLQLCLHIGGADKQLRSAPGIVRHSVIHHHRHTISLRHTPVSGRRGDIEVRPLCIFQHSQAQALAQRIDRHIDSPAGLHRLRRQTENPVSPFKGLRCLCQADRLPLPQERTASRLRIPGQLRPQCLHQLLQPNIQDILIPDTASA